MTLELGDILQGKYKVRRIWGVGIWGGGECRRRFGSQFLPDKLFPTSRAIVNIFESFLDGSLCQKDLIYLPGNCEIFPDTCDSPTPPDKPQVLPLNRLFCPDLTIIIFWKLFGTGVSTGSRHYWCLSFSWWGYWYPLPSDCILVLRYVIWRD